MLKRHIQKEVEAYLEIMPVVLIAGARQTGKTTYVRQIAKERGYAFFTFDDVMTLANAKRDPVGWLKSLPKPVVIDEIQRVPEIFLSLKKDVDTNNKPGRYLLTGSANPLLIPHLGDSLAGRMGIINMFPFSFCEKIEKKESFISLLFKKKIPIKTFPDLDKDLIVKELLWGGYPPVQTFKKLADVNRWIKAYLQTIMERDVRDIANIEGVREFPNLFRLLASRNGGLLNISSLSRSLGMVHMTLNRYMRLLETLYFIHLLPSWYHNLGKRMIKSPKIYISDTAIVTSLLGMNEGRLLEDPMLFGQLLEGYVFSELLKQQSWAQTDFELYHFRDGSYEVDFILEKSDGTVTGIEVKSAQSIHTGDLKGLKHLKSISKKRFDKGIILYLGAQTEYLDEDLWAVPFQALWGGEE
jgi:predicted AAA+ superfamily ATPase